jgi:SAM-dependent methyltransferase
VSAAAGTHGGYSAEFYAEFNERSYRAARVLLEEVYALHPYGSMVDFGCGSGTWLRAAAEIVRARGRAPDVLGVDGAHVAEISDHSSGARYLLQDLENRVRLERRFELAISVEVAEHLSPQRGPSFVEDLCAASDVVLFGASIPGQGGLEGGVHHVNEQWQDYWAQLFAAQGYACLDLLRDKYWNDARFASCSYYVANALVYVRDGHALLARCASRVVTEGWRLRVVHPRVYESSHAESAGFLPTLRSMPRKLVRALRRRWSRR